MQPKVIEIPNHEFDIRNESADSGVKLSRFINIDDGIIKVSGLDGRILLEMAFAPENVKEMPFSLFKYIQHRYSVESIDNKRLTFVSPLDWEDPYESALLDEKSYGKRVFCLCATMSRSMAEESFWKRCDPNYEGKYVMWRLNFYNLFNALKDISSKLGVKFFVAPMIYSYSRDDIDVMLKTKPTSLSSQIDRLCLKRKAFSHEFEIRIFAVIDPSGNFDVDGNYLNLSIDLFQGNPSQHILQKVVLPPYKPGKKGTYAKDEYAVLQHVMNMSKRKYYMNTPLGAGNHGIEQSHLYEVKYSHTKKMSIKVSNYIM